MSEGMNMRIYTVAPLRLAPPRMAVAIPKEAVAASMLEARRREHEHEVARTRAWMQRELLSPMWRQLYEDYATMEARAEVMRPSIGKPLSRRARRRNRGRVLAAKVALMRRLTPSVSWTWPSPNFAKAA